MSKSTDEAYALLGIVNDSELARKFGPDFCPEHDQSPYGAYHPGQNGLASYSPFWSVVRPGFQTDPRGGYPAYGSKSFGVYGREQKLSVMGEAIAWASNRYHINSEGWRRSPFGGWHPGPVMDAFDAAVKAARAGARHA